MLAGLTVAAERGMSAPSIPASSIPAPSSPAQEN
jgi:hypothetical protein